MKTRPLSASTAPSPGSAARRTPQHPARRRPARTAREQAVPIGDPGALEYASWLRLLRRPAP